MDGIETSEMTALEQRQALLAHHVRLVARRHSHALFVFGSQGGLGKSRTILATLEDEGVSPILINSHVTPLALYGILYQHRDDEAIFFDDVDSMFSSMAHLGLLRSALWGTPRIVTYNSTQLTDLPSSFEFTSRCIFACNVIPKKNDAFRAVLSRCDQFELSATNEQVIDLMRSVAANGFNGITPDECQEIIDYIAENSDDRQLSMRLLGPSIRKFQYARSERLDWRSLLKSQLQTLGRKNEATKRLDSKSKDIKMLQNVITNHPDSVKDQQVAWCRSLGKSRASFYRTLSRYKDEVGD
ncbi:hypothetical protein [Novipirellula artificiosorum]|uniref:Uncharacterized protein n=1 Tax=Novipirellula artificiosorum TaxID=2528016 RepID=A0A5C6E067_9BACT|nr:hypothetical protein [Novipirellula artificiosorum]TWU41874.1 hypothetical protein Poly41_01670 [Novipirellula artificiosorum]